jgi:hypothetical protein
LWRHSIPLPEDVMVSIRPIRLTVVVLVLPATLFLGACSSPAAATPSPSGMMEEHPSASEIMEEHPSDSGMMEGPSASAP